jgi:tagatose 6-phosphate kinase
LIIAAGLTPSWQQTLLFEEFRTGHVNRAREVRWHAAGKAVNVGIALHHLGAESLTLFLAGGAVGENIHRDLDALGVPHQRIWHDSESRVCTTIIDRGQDQITELVANAPPVTDEDLQQFYGVYGEAVRRADLVVLSGSLPAGTPVSFYRDLIALTSCPVILDASGPELIEALASKPFCIKPNREELSRSLGRRIDDETGLQSAMLALHERGAASVLVSQGARSMMVLVDGHFYQIVPPKVEVLNPIGSGDCLAAGLAAGMNTGMPMLESIRFGVAAGTVNAESLLSARLDHDRVRALFPSVTVRPL